MTHSDNLLLVLVIPVAAAVAWITARTLAPDAPGNDPSSLAALDTRLQRLEKATESQRSPQARDDRGLARRVDALEARLGTDTPRESSAAPGNTTSVSGAGGASTAAADAKEAASPALAFTAAEIKLHEETASGVTADLGSAEHRAALKRLADHLARSGGPPPVEKELLWAAALLDKEARRERVTPHEAEDVASILLGLPSGHAARPGLAKAVVIGWSKDERLGGFFGRLAPNAEPTLHRGVLSVLDDEHPSPAYTEYVMRLVREEKDPIVLGGALDLDRIEAAATASSATKLAQTVEARVLDGTLDATMRSAAGLAIAVCGLKAPETGIEMLNRLAGKETDADIAEQYREAAASLRSGSATLKSLEQIFE